MVARAGFEPAKKRGTHADFRPTVPNCRQGQLGIKTMPGTQAIPKPVEGWDPVWTRISAGVSTTCVSSDPVLPPAWGVPTAPVITKARSGNRNGTLTITAPAETYLMPVLSYIVRCTSPSSNVTKTFATNATSLFVTSLINQVAYSCTVAAVTTYGEGPVSNIGRLLPDVRTCESGTCCWGANTAGNLGRNNTVTPVKLPSDVLGAIAPDIALVSAANNFACALTTSGLAYCYGNNM